jgi:FHS family Na+ dependent glucose MFS transporter 1
MVLVFVVLGLAYGCCDVSGNTMVVWSRPDGSGSLLNGLHLCFAVGALLAPLVVNRALAWTSSLWPAVVPLAAMTAWCVVALAVRPAPVRTRNPASVPIGAARAARSARVGQLAAICLFFLVYVGVENGFAGWIHSYVEQIGYGGSGTATGVTAIFWTGFVCGRFIAIRVAQKVSAARLLFGSMAAMIISAIGLVVVGGAGAWLWVASFLFGLTIAPQFASMIAFAEAHLTLSGRSTAAFIAAAGIGGLAMPWLLGRLFDTQGADVLPPVVLISSIIAAAIAVMVGWMLVGGARRARGSGQRPPATSMKAPVT